MKRKHVLRANYLAVKVFTLGLAVILLASCTSTKKLKKCQANNSRLDSQYQALNKQFLDLQLMYKACEDSNAMLVSRVNALHDQVGEQRSTNGQLIGQLKDLSVISSSQAESIQKSLDNIGVKDAYIKQLQSAINRKDSMNMALVINLKSAIGNLDDKDINIKVDKGVVYVDISDKLLFSSGKYQVTDKAKVVLGKVAKVLEAQPSIEFMVEGHTDNVPFSNGQLQDNWDLSCKRATSVIRILQDQYHIPPARMTASGRGEYTPIASNDSQEGRAQNRRTRIVILPQLDQFFKLLEKPGGN